MNRFGALRCLSVHIALRVPGRLWGTRSLTQLRIEKETIVSLDLFVRAIDQALVGAGGKNVPDFCRSFRKMFSGLVHYDVRWYLRTLL